VGGRLELLTSGVEPKGACVVSCWDPRLTRRFAGWDETFVLRVPGAVLRSGRDLVRALGYAVYVKECAEVIVLGHTGCGLANISAGALADGMRKRGVAREAVAEDLRAFVGAFGDPRQAAQETAAALRDAPELPADLPVHAALMDTAKGSVSVIENGDTLTRAARGGAGAGVPVRGPVELAPVNLEAPKIAGGYPEIKPIDWAPSVVIGSAAEIAASPEISAAAYASAPMSYAPQETMRSIEPEIVVESVIVGRTPPPAPQVARGGGKAKKAVATLEGGKVIYNGERAIPDDLRRALFRVRDFYRTEFSASARRDLTNGLDGAAAQGASASDLTKIAIRPVLSLGQERYKVINELLAIKEQVARTEPPVAHALLRTLVE
jgi:carbonic anhydrase